MAINGSGVRDTARVLKIDKGTIISTLKKANTLVQVKPKLFNLSAEGEMEVRLEATCEVEMDEQWSYVGNIEPTLALVCCASRDQYRAGLYVW